MGYFTPEYSEVSPPESQDCSTGDREMVQGVRHLLCKCEDVSSNLRTHFKPGAVAHICNHSTPLERWEVGPENPWSHRPPSLIQSCKQPERDPASNPAENKGHTHADYWQKALCKLPM